MKTDHKKKLFNSKLRILINVTILRRDIGVCFFLKRVLEDFNFDVLLSAPSNNVKNINFNQNQDQNNPHNSNKTKKRLQKKLQNKKDKEINVEKLNN